MAILDETRLTLTELAQRERVNVATVWRWTTAGARGVVLESVAIGGKRFTSVEAFTRWVAAQNPTLAAVTTKATEAARKRRSADASRELEAAGY